VAFATNIWNNMEMLAQGASIATIVTNLPKSEIPVRQLGFKNVPQRTRGSSIQKDEGRAIGMI
jgi:hypothetical protein